MRDSFENEIWVGAFRSSRFNYPEKPGMAFKFMGHKWEPLIDARPPMPDDFHVNMNKHNLGETLTREQFPEAACVFNESFFEKVGELVWFRGFMGVRGLLAQIFMDSDIGKGGGLIPVSVYDADCKTKRDEPFFLVNWGQHDSQCFDPDRSSGIEKIASYVPNSPDFWSLGYGDFEISVRDNALNGPDIWVERSIRDLTFMKGHVAKAILDSDQKTNMILSKCVVRGDKQGKAG